MRSNRLQLNIAKTAPDTSNCSDSRQRHCDACEISAWPRHLCRLWPVHKNTHLENSVWLLCDVATNPKHSPLCHETCASVTHRVSVSHEIGLNCCTTLTGLPNNQLCQLQAVQHAAARLILHAKKYDHWPPYSGNCSTTIASQWRSTMMMMMMMMTIIYINSGTDSSP